jgi:prepilin-type N-terminal cleavage/methylation domain-containing protein
MKANKGFTLLELLIVIAIIGLLAVVVAISAGSSRTKAADAAAMRALTQIRSRAQYLYSTTGTYYSGGFGYTYSDICNSEPDSILEDPNIHAIITAIRPTLAGDPSCLMYPNDYAIVFPLKSGQFACMDARNTLRTKNANGQNYTCLDCSGVGARPAVDDVEGDPTCN